MLRKLLICLSAGGSLLGCVTTNDQGETVLSDGLDTMPVMYCATDNSPAAKADWSKATVVKESVKDRLYESGLMTLWHAKPYIIRITNNDTGVRSFRAPEFLRDVAILKVVYKEKAFDAPCLNALTLAPGTTAELHVVPLKPGYYDYHETGIWVPFMGEWATNADVGVIYVH